MDFTESCQLFTWNHVYVPVKDHLYDSELMIQTFFSFVEILHKIVFHNPRKFHHAKKLILIKYRNILQEECSSNLN